MAVPDDRAASEVIGAVLIFGFLVVTFAIYQGVVIPQQNRAAEFEHNQAAQKSIQELRNAVRQTAATASEQSVSVTLGATYPQRILGLNPGISAGSVNTEDIGSMAIQNISATEPEVADYFGTTTTTLGSFDSKTIIYRPVYSHYTERPETSYENTLAFNRFPNGVNLSITDQAMIDGQKITLIALAGNVSEARQDTITVDTKAVSTATNTVTVTNASGPITITIPTRLSAADWEALLDDELTPNGHVTAVSQTGPNQVSISLAPNVRYELRLAKVRVGTGASAEGPKYIVDIEGDETSVIENGTQKLVAEVRDRFNNPVSNVTVSADSPGPGSVSPSTERTRADGRATFIYSAPTNVDGARDVDIDVSFDGDGTVNETVTFDVRVLDADGSGGGGGTSDVEDVNPGGDGSVILVDQSAIGGGGATDVSITLENSTQEADLNLTAARVSFYFNGNPGGGDTDPSQVDLYSTAQGVTAAQATTLLLGDDFTSLTEEIPLNPTASNSADTTVIDLSFDEEVEADDFYVVSFTFSNGDTYTYFVSHPD